MRPIDPVVSIARNLGGETVSKAMTFRRAALVAMTAFVASGAAVGLHAAQSQQDPQPWVHVDMTGQTSMSLNLPLAAIEAALAMAPETIVDRDGQLQLGGQREIPVTAIRAAWTQLRDAGDVEIANIEDEGQSVRIAREGDTIVVDVTGTDDEPEGGADDDAEHEGDGDGQGAEHRDGDHDGAGRGRARGFVGEVQVRVPVSVVDALLSGAGETLDVRGAIQELSALRGEMVQVVHPEGRVRVWIDESPTQ